MRRYRSVVNEKVEVKLNAYADKETEHLLTHKPKMAGCPACSIGKTKHKRDERKHTPQSTKYKGFGDLITLDHIDARGASGSAMGHIGIFSILAVATGYKMAYPVRSKSEEETTYNLKRFKGIHKVTSMYCDRAPELAGGRSQHRSSLRPLYSWQVANEFLDRKVQPIHQQGD